MTSASGRRQSSASAISLRSLGPDAISMNSAADSCALSIKGKTSTPPSPLEASVGHSPLATPSLRSTSDDPTSPAGSLREVDHRDSHPSLQEDGRPLPSLPPVDGGRAAWSYLLAATVLETLVWGLPLSFGVFLPVYDEAFVGQGKVLPEVGTISTGIMYLLLPPLAHILSLYPHLRKPSMWCGLILLAMGLLGAGFAQSAGGLIGFQGVLYALGGICLYCPVTSYMFEWWRLRRGLASGIMFSGTGVGGLTMPFICDGLLRRFGRRVTLVSLAVAYVILLGINIPFIRPRIALQRRKSLRLSLKTSAFRKIGGRAANTASTDVSLSDSSDNAHPPNVRVDYGFLKKKAFWLLFLGVLFQGLGGFMPGTYLPSFASRLELTPATGTLSVALMNLARIPGQILIGHLSDKLGARKLILGMALASSISVFAIWGAATGQAALLVFSLMFGAFAGSYTALFPKFISIIAEDDPTLPPILYAAFSFARGIGNIVSGPVSTQLMAITPGWRQGGYGVDGYGVLIIWTGSLLLGSGVGAGYKGLKRD